MRTRDSLWPSTHKGRSCESTASCTLFNHSWISSSQSVQKETLRAYHLMMLRFTFLSQPIQKVDYETRTTTHGTHPISRHWSGVAHDPTLGLHVSLSQSNDRDIVPAKEPLFPTSIIVWTSTLRLCMRSVLSGAFSVLPRWMERQGCELASRIWNSIKIH